MPKNNDLEAFLNHFAIHSFRNIADGDYISARMCFRATLWSQYLWASQQAIEKYLKCILLLERIPAPKVGHNLCQALQLIFKSQAVSLKLTKSSQAFIEYVDGYGVWR